MKILPAVFNIGKYIITNSECVFRNTRGIINFAGTFEAIMNSVGKNDFYINVVKNLHFATSYPRSIIGEQIVTLIFRDDENSMPAGGAKNLNIHEYHHDVVHDDL